MRGLAGVCLLVLSPGLAGPAGAQVAGDTVPVFEVAPVLVEVFRFPVDPARLPYASSLVELGRARATGSGLALDEVLRGVPGVQVDNRYNFAVGERLAIRGFGARAQFGVRGARLLVDGIPATFADGQSALDVIDPAVLDRVEVIRGPASALHGNAAGGAVLFRTHLRDAPGHDQHLRLVGDGVGALRLQGGVEGGGALPYRAHLSHLAFDGFREHSRARILRGGLQVGGRAGPGTLRVVAAGSEFDARNPGSLDAEAFAADPTAAFAGNVAQGTGKSGRQGQLGVVWRGDALGGIAEAAAHGIVRDIRNPIPATIIDLDRTAIGGRAHLRVPVALPGGTAEVGAGVDWDLQRDDRQNRQNVGGEPGGLVVDQFETVRAVAPSLLLRMPLARGFAAEAALRYDRFLFRADDRLGSGPDDQSGERRMDAWSPSAGVLGELGPVTAFANLTTAFETPTTTELANRPDGSRGFNFELEPQRTRSWEAGLRVGGGADAELGLTVHSARVRNALVPFQTDGGRDYFRNAGAARHRGIELSLGGAAGPVGARLAYALTDARFTRYETGGQDHSGRRVPGVAPHRVEATVELAAARGAILALDGDLRGRTPVDDANANHAASYLLLGVRGRSPGLRVGGGRLVASAGVRNLLDVRHAASIVPNAFGGRFFEPGPGRTGYLGVEVRTGGS